MSAYAETRLSLYDHLDLLDMMEQAESSPEVQEHLTAQIKDQIAKGARDKIESIHRLLAQLDATDLGINAEMVRLNKRAQQVDRVRQSVRQMVQRGMTAHGIKSIEGQTCKFVIKKSPPHVVIEDEEAIPNQFKQATVTLPLWLWNLNAIAGCSNVKVSIQKAEISKHLKGGVVVPGADLSMNDEYLSVE